MGKKEVILQTAVRYSDSTKEKRSPLKEWLGERSYDQFKSEATSVIEKDLPLEMRELFGISVRSSRVIRFEEGSIEILFAVSVGAISFLSGYAGFFDSIELIKKQTTVLLRRLLNKEKYGGGYSISTDTVWPRIRDPYNYPYKYFSKSFGLFEEDLFPFLMQVRGESKRDSFFWFLLGFNIVLLFIVATLVGMAVYKTYFKEPESAVTKTYFYHDAQHCIQSDLVLKSAQCRLS